jgi:hypothetical protein
MRYRITPSLLIAAIGVLCLTVSATASPVLNWVDVEPGCHALGDPVIVLANVTLGVPCYTLEHHITEDLNGDFHIGLEFIPKPNDCLEVVVDTTYEISISPTCMHHTIEVHILGESTSLETYTNCASKGDVNLNGVPYEVSDLIRLIRCSLQGHERDEWEITCWVATADLNRDGRVNLVDIVWLRQIITGDRAPDPE